MQLLRAYTVFNVDQGEGLPTHFYAAAEPRLTGAQRIDHAEAFCPAVGDDLLGEVGAVFGAQLGGGSAGGGSRRP